MREENDMSMKSFDKFCEKLILGEPASQKEILDERQKIIRMRIIAETLGAFAALLMVNNFIMENVYKWADDFFMPIAPLMTVCLMYYTVRCFAKDCLIGINGAYSAKFAAGYAIFLGIMMLLTILPGENEEFIFIADGKATAVFLKLITWIMFVVYGILSFILIKKAQKRREREEE